MNYKFCGEIEEMARGIFETSRKCNLKYKNIQCNRNQFNGGKDMLTSFPDFFNNADQMRYVKLLLLILTYQVRQHMYCV